MGVRTFVAIDLSDAAGGAVRAWLRRMSACGANVRWVDGSSWHLTLKFLGDVAESRLWDIAKCVGLAVEATEPFEVELIGAGAFPQRERPRTLWLGIGDGKESVIDLAGKIETGLISAGFRPEGRVFHPHLTIGRVRDGQQIERLAEGLEQAQDVSWGRFSVQEVLVLSSELRQAGPVYTQVACCELAGGAR